MTTRFAFADVVGQDDAKLALTLAAIDPLLGGVLLRGQKGSAKTTLARGIGDLLGGFTELPLGTTEDRLLGTVDIRATLDGAGDVFRPGLLAAADGGVLYVDEVNLLADHLVDVLLDVAVSGEHVVERDGISHRHPARFVLVGSMNPEEGELRPQLLDRFGLCIDVVASTEVDDRVEAVRRRLRFDATGAPGDDDGLADRIRATRSATVGDDVIEAASRLALGVGAEGLRADLALCRAAAAFAGWDGRATTTPDDLRRVAHLVLAHRARRNPFDPPTLPPDALAGALDDVLGPSPEAEADVDEPAGDDERPVPVGAGRRPPVPRAAIAPSPRGRFVRTVPAGDRPDLPVAPLSTARALATRRRGDPQAPLAPTDLRADVRVARATRLVVVCVDLSGSMGQQRAAAATGAVVGLLDDAYRRRHRVALVGFRGDGAEVLLAPTSSVEIARNRLGDLATGGATPLAAGIRTALDVITRADHEDALLVVLTDGRATGVDGAVDESLAAAVTVRRRGVPALVLDCEDGAIRLGLAAQLAAAMGARHVHLADVGDDLPAVLA